MEGNQDLPIALRRTPRASVGGDRAAPSKVAEPKTSALAAASRTPGKPRARKRVRFSDPGPEIEHHDSEGPAHSSPSSTGLTPMVRRSSLRGTTPPSKRRRHSTPLRTSSSLDDDDGEQDELAGPTNTAGNKTSEIHFFSLRQVLDDRVKRRIRRNGLSEEMNTIAETKRRTTRDREAEMQRLRDELAQKDEEIERLHNTTLVQDTDRILDLEQEVEQLRTELLNRTSAAATPAADETQHFDWTLAARDPFSDSYMDDDDEGFGDSTMADLVCGTPSRTRGNAGGSFPTPPCTSPTIPSTPCSMRRAAPATPKSHAGVQASLPDPEKQALEEELGSLRLELAKLTDTLESHAALQGRLAAKLSSASSVQAETSADVEAHLDSVLQSLSDRTAALLDLNSSLSTLGFAGNDAGEIVASLSGAFRSARLELEYLTPGEIALPLSSRGAEVLDLVLSRLRDLGRQTREDETTIDEYHALELSLRQQLGARVDAMDGARRDLQRARAESRDKDARIGDLEVGLDRLKGAAEGYRRDIAELEDLVQRVEQEGAAAEARLQTDLSSTREDLAGRGAAVSELEAKLASVLEQTEALRTQIADLQARKASEIRALNRSHGHALALRDARVAELRGEIDSINASLREAHETIRQLRVENGGLARRVDDEKSRAKVAVDAMKAELERVMQMSSGLLAAASTPKEKKKTRTATVIEGPAARTRRRSSVGGKRGQPAAVGEAEGGVKGKKRRRYDSGLGFLDEDEDGDEVDMVA
ncbi:hypothetical protein F4778DRAFT_686981 [Xylariomycetidae sp. FL2044]|nr:hypothetical protein F4778DRAFT_686981 [Xylariomycetidae sp. FL2044]